MAANKCAIDSVYPCVFTLEIEKICYCKLNNTSEETKDNTNYAWVCLPCTLVLDILTLVPFAGFYICKKTCFESSVKEDVITTQPTIQ